MRVVVVAGTEKGAFLCTSDRNRRAWRVDGPIFKGWKVTPESFRVPGYPVVPIAFAAVAAAVVLSVIWADPTSAFRGTLLLAGGLPVYYWFSSRTR